MTKIDDKREEIKGYDELEALATDFVWSWNQNHSVDKVWELLDPELWELLRNPWVVLQTVSTEKLKQKLADPSFCKLVSNLIKTYQVELKTPAWFEQTHSSTPLTRIAYFSMEYMLDEALPIYSGGLGNVAGDQLKAASDLGVPVVAIGLLYQQGYFRQVIDKDGAQKAFYPFNSPEQLPITPLRRSNGEWLRIEIALPGWSVWLRAWEVKIGRVKLYLLDSNDASNYPPHRGITSELYGGDAEIRLQQELILGIGGWRLLEELRIKPEVCHLNEGHAAFAILERAKYFMQETKVSFEAALATTKAGNLFTTHTAVPAGFDRFSPFLIEQYLGKYAREKLGITVQDLLAFGRQNPNDQNENFNMAYLAIRGSGAINGVSRLHGKVSRQIFSSLFPRWPEEEVPVSHVTNGVHMPSWNSIEAGNLWKQFCGTCHLLGTTCNLERDFKNVPDDKLWQMRSSMRKNLITYARGRLAKQLAARGFSEEMVEFAKRIFDPNTLTLGFARRFATYKRPNMLLHDQERLVRILNNTNRPVQLIIAGKAHPADKLGQDLIQQWILFLRRPDVRPHAIFLSDYDILLTEHLVRGVDLWINTPRRPWEACGTSGMKVLGNGGINLSELDGWWSEAYSPEVGWALGDGQEHDADPAIDAEEASKLYDILEKEVIPEFYTRNKEGIPTKWVSRIRESMSQLSPRFSADRTVRQYTEEYYLPAANLFRKKSANGAALGKQIVDWKNSLKQNWSFLRFGQLKVETAQNKHTFEVQLYLNGVDPNAVKVQLYSNGPQGPSSIEMTRIKQLVGDPSTYLYSASVPADRPPSEYTPRAVPFFPDCAVPLEASEILWQR
ncbi:MAG: alpha-glucan family phosphorylase [Chlamydiae bacterium]|nr:alpha-glucan family phosphorylase [Chlamydiota bacterium]